MLSEVISRLLRRFTGCRRSGAAIAAAADVRLATPDTRFGMPIAGRLAIVCRSQILTVSCNWVSLGTLSNATAGLEVESLTTQDL